MGAPRDCYQRIRDAYEENTRLGMLAGATEVLGYATEALLLAGDLERAQKQLEEALHIADKLGERVYLPQLYLMEAAIARARGERKAAEVSVRRAITEARAQQAPWLELMALIDLCENDRATPEDRSALAALVDQLPEASDTTAVAKARALIDTKRSSLPRHSRLRP
jgi:ATP/maltotriose-dependent transcriptional regulator MalT